MRRVGLHRAVLREQSRVRVQQRGQEARLHPVEFRIRPLRLFREYLPPALSLEERPRMQASSSF